MKQINLKSSPDLLSDLNNIEYIKREADHCVKCGLCLPHCPTYIITRDEGDSPRGRIALMQGLAHGQLEVSTRFEFHLDRCLTCRACEDVCPSKVHYGQLIDAGRTLVRQRSTPSVIQRLTDTLLDLLVTRTPLLRLCAQILRLYQKSGLRWLTRKSGLLHAFGLRRFEYILPDIPPQSGWLEFYPAYGNETGHVALFTGCIGSVLDRDAINASIEILRHCGYGVHVPKAQTCCGALHLHGGRADQANTLAQTNLDVFNGLNIDAVLFTSSGCGATLNEYSLMDNRHRFTAPVMDICQFLGNIDWPAHMTFKPLHQQVVIHDPCSLRHVLHQHEAPYALLNNIPDLTLTALPDNDRCCGAAGSYMLSQPDMADSLRGDKMKYLEQAKPGYLVTSNIGCALHLMAGIKNEGINIEVMHPVTLLAQQIARHS